MMITVHLCRLYIIIMYTSQSARIAARTENEREYFTPDKRKTKSFPLSPN